MEKGSSIPNCVAPGGCTPPQLKNLNLTSSQLVLGGSLAAALVLILVLLTFNRRRSKARGNSLVLVGAPDAGKTALLASLVHGTSLPTLTSIQPNSSLIPLSNDKNIRVVDIPGHPRIRNQFKEYLNDASVVAFVVDASTVSRNGAGVAEHLHMVMHEITSLPPSQTLPTLLVVAHKTDLLASSTAASASSSATAITRIKTVLERELQKRRSASSSGVAIEGLGDSDSNEKDAAGSGEMGGLETTGPKGGVFKFSEWEGGEVCWVGTSSKPKKEGVDEKQGSEEGQEGMRELREWIEENM